MKLENSFDQGVWIFPNFLAENLLDSVRKDLDGCYQAGLFRAAAIGKGARQEKHPEIRSDEILWLNPATESVVQAQLLAKMHELKTEFNRTYYLGLNDFQGHYAVYPQGAFYQRHLDAFKNDSSRTLSAVLYLNPEWTPEMGGQLRLHLDTGIVDIEPTGGKLVCFLSREIEHEVLPSHSIRRSFTGWFTDRTKIL